MKAAFNILPAPAENNSLHLLIESGSYGISFVWFSKSPFSIKGLVAYNFSTIVSGEDIRNLLQSQELLLEGLLSTTICYDLKESLLVPGNHNHTGISESALSLLYGEDTNGTFNNDLITSAGIYNHYRIPMDLAAAFSERFPSANIFHSTSLQVEHLNEESELLYCILFHNILKTILYKDGKLQIVQQFNYVAPEDVAYHLLNVCEQHAVKPSEVQLRLSGMIDEQSRLYLELYKYFLNIDFEHVEEDIYAAAGMKELPAHFFSHLTILALCAS